ncbi:glycosyltransferase [Streptococcus parasuis]
MSKIKIMHLLQSNRYSGAENMVCQIIESTMNLSDEYEMIYVSPKGPIEEFLIEKNIKFIGLERFTQKEIGKAISIFDPDIIHAHDFNASVRVARYKKIIISHLHNNPNWFSKLDYRTLIYTFFLNRFKKVIGVSKSIKNEYIFSRLLEKKFLVLPNVIDKEKVRILAKEDSPSSDILYVGRLSKEKDPLSFLEIVKKLVITYPNIQAIMIGEGPLLIECEDYIRNNSLSDNIKLFGFNKNPYKFMSKTKLLVMTSVYEGFGLVAIESMLLNTPVVCRPVGGLVDFIDNKNGALCNTIDEFVFKINYLLTYSNELHKRGTLSSEVAEKYSNISTFQVTLDSLYKKLLVEARYVSKY